MANESFFEWLNRAGKLAIAEGISVSTVEESLLRANYSKRAIYLDNHQPEKTITFAEYVLRLVNNARIIKGKEMMNKHSNLLSAIERKYGVPRNFIVALWGIESDFGRRMGNFLVIDTLSSLAYEGRRREFFFKELMSALRIIDAKHIKADQMFGSWAGAIGQVQFMPSTFLAYAKDFNGDGRKDIWHTTEDVLASIAGYLSSLGWDYRNDFWSCDIILPAGFNKDLLGVYHWKNTKRWQRLGVILSPDCQLALDKGLDTAVISVDKETKLLVGRNFRKMMIWNRSYYFAASVGRLAKSLLAD